MRLCPDVGWDGIVLNHKIPRCGSQGSLIGVSYRGEILQPIVLPSSSMAIGLGNIFQDNNARYLAAGVNLFLQQHLMKDGLAGSIP